jgi:hypothetical protein
VHCSRRKSPRAFPVPHHGEEGLWADGPLGPVAPKSSQLTDPDWDGGTMPGPVTVIQLNCHLLNFTFTTEE